MIYFLLQALADADPQFLRITIALTNALIAVTAVITGLARLFHYWRTRKEPKMTAKGTKVASTKRTERPPSTEVADFLAGELIGEFSELPEQLANTIGQVARLAITGGGYIGLSVSDDGVSAKLVVNRGQLRTERRFYRITDLEAALAICFSKLRSS